LTDINTSTGTSAFDPDKLLVTRDRVSATELRKIFDRWFNRAVKLVGEKSVGALGIIIIIIITIIIITIIIIISLHEVSH